MKVHIDVVLPEGTANGLAAACLKFGIERDLFIQRAIEEKLALMADDGAHWADSPREATAFVLRKRSDEEE